MTENLAVFICQKKPSPCFDHSALEILEMIVNRLDMIDIDLIYGIFQALEGKHLTPANWMNLFDVVRDFNPEPDEKQEIK